MSGPLSGLRVEGGLFTAGQRLCRDGRAGAGGASWLSDERDTAGLESSPPDPLHDKTDMSIGATPAACALFEASA